MTSSARASTIGGTVETERFGGFKIDHKLVLGRLLDRQVRGFCTMKNAIDICGRTSKLVDLVDSIGNETTVSGIKPKWIDRRQTIACGKVDNKMSSGHRMRRYNHPAPRQKGKLRNGGFDFLGVAHTEWDDLYLQHHRRSLSGLAETRRGRMFPDPERLPRVPPRVQFPSASAAICFPSQAQNW